MRDVGLLTWQKSLTGLQAATEQLRLVVTTLLAFRTSITALRHLCKSQLPLGQMQEVLRSLLCQTLGYSIHIRSVFEEPSILLLSRKFHDQSGNCQTQEMTKEFYLSEEEIMQ